MRGGRLLWVAVGGLLVLALLTIVVVGSTALVGRVFPGFLAWDNGVLVAFHTESWTGARSGMPLNGGRLVAVDGAPFAGGRALLEHVSALEPATPVTYRVATDRGEREFRVETMRMSWLDYLLTFGNYLFNAVMFFVVALVALALRSDLPAARALAALSTSLGLLMTLTVDFFTTYRFVVACQLVEAISPAALAWVGLVFPTERAGPATRRWLVPLLFVLAAGMGLANVWAFRADPELGRGFTSLAYLLTAGIALALLINFGSALRSAAEVKPRVQAAVVFAGGLVAFLFPSMAVLAFYVLGWTFSFTWVTALLFFFPASILWAIVRYDLLAAERFIRLTVGYAVATSAVMLGYAAIVFVLERFVSPGAAQSPFPSFVALMAVAVLFDPVRRRVQGVVDRVFYRSIVDVARVLEEVGADLAECGSEDEVRARVARTLENALNLEWAELATDADPREPAEHRTKVSFRGDRLGTISCGPKRSGAPFSAMEHDLVRGLASQSALALRNLRSFDELRAAQEIVLRTERLAVVGEFAAAVAHGLRNPLAGIRAAAQMAREEAGTGPLSETLDSLILEADRLEQRVRSLLDFSRPFEPAPRKVAIEPLLHAVERAIAPQAGEQGVSLVVEASAEVPALDVDPDYLEEVLLELAGNALRAMPEGGVLSLTAAPEGRSTVIRVADSGAGIPPGVQNRIFDLFFTTRSEGTGVGLATVKKIIERLGGTVGLERSDEQGTTFRVELG